MSPALVQALQRLLVIGAVGALTAVGLNLTVLNGALPEATLLVPIITAVIGAVLKFLGGETVTVAHISTVTGGKMVGVEPPPFWSV